MRDLKSCFRDVFRELDARFERSQRLPPPPARRDLAYQPREVLLDRATTLRAGDLAVVGAREEPDAFVVLMRIAVDAALTEPRRDVLVVADDVETVDTVLIATLAEVPIQLAATRTGTRQQLVDMAYAEGLLQRSPIQRVAVDKLAKPTNFVRAWMTRAAERLVILPAAWPVSARDEKGASGFIREAKTIARDTTGAIVVPWRLRQCSRTARLSDLATSGALEDDVDLVVLATSRTSRGRRISIAKNTRCVTDRA